MFQYQYAVIGGDMRQKLLLKKLYHSGHACIYFGLAEIEENIQKATSVMDGVINAENILLPIPMCKGKYLFFPEHDIEMESKMLLPYIQQGQRIFAGNIESKWKRKVQEKGALCFDYMEERTIVIYNSIATAEGMIAEMIKTYPKNLHRERILILGFGTCGKILAKKLNALDAFVTVAARTQEALMEAYANGFQSFSIEELQKKIKGFSIIVNTIPAKILNRKILSEVNKDAALYELASFPYGFDTTVAKEIGLNYHICSALPGKYAPASSADMLKRFVEEKQGG